MLINHKLKQLIKIKLKLKHKEIDFKKSPYIRMTSYILR